MRQRRSPQAQTSFEWFASDVPGPVDDDIDAAGGGVADYPLHGPDRFRELHLELPPGFTFYLGTHHAGDLAVSPVPLFLSRRALVLNAATKGTGPADWPKMDRQRRTLPRAVAPWAIDSAGFTELNQFGCHHIPPSQYAAEVCRYASEIGKLRFAAVQDWMCEEQVLRVTGQDVDRHQRRTIESYMQLASIAPGLPWAPVLQGFFPGDHERHLAMYYKNGIDLRCFPTVGVGSVCRRQGMVEADEIVRRLSGTGIKLHLFGYKFTGLPGTIRYVSSADSMAWSMVARKQLIQMPGHDHSTPSTGELWRRGRVKASIQREEHSWIVRRDTRRPDEVERVATRASGQEALSRDGYVFVRLMWTCQNCLVWAMLWRNNMLAMAVSAARSDHVERHYGHRALTSSEREEMLAFDPTEFWPAAYTKGDYELARERMQRLSGVRVPRKPRCATKAATDRPCQPARYIPRGGAAPTWPAAPPARVMGLGPYASLDDFRPWSPGSGGTLLDERPSPIDDDAVAEFAREAAAETHDPEDITMFYPVERPELAWSVASNRLTERLPSSPAFQRFLSRMIGLPRSRIASMSRRFREAYEAELWSLYEADAGEQGGARPSSSHGWGAVLPLSV